MNSGPRQSTVFTYIITYNTYRTALAAGATSAYDATALANTPSGATNPINSMPNLDVKSPNGLAIGLNTPELSFKFMSGPCATFTGSGCIGLNVALANSIGGALMAAVEHEIDEVLGLGSALNGTMIPSDSWPEDLFRWASRRRSRAGLPRPARRDRRTAEAFDPFREGKGVIQVLVTLQ